jgi:sugar O-acyltransferase (sialic acid O-acetyltransferase NeuD family)
MHPRRLTVFGVASPYAWDVVDIALARDWVVSAFDNVGGADARLPGLTLEADPQLPMTLGLGSANARATAAWAAWDAGFREVVSLVAPFSSVASTSSLGHGSFVNAGAVIGSNTRIGCHANINRSASVGHDNTIGFAATVGPGATLAGSVVLAPRASIGAGAVVLPGRTIGLGAVVGAGAVVTRDVDDFAVVVGNPARVVRVETAFSAEEAMTCPNC